MSIPVNSSIPRPATRSTVCFGVIFEFQLCVETNRASDYLTNGKPSANPAVTVCFILLSRGTCGALPNNVTLAPASARAAALSNADAAKPTTATSGLTLNENHTLETNAKFVLSPINLRNAVGHLCLAKPSLPFARITCLTVILC